MFPRGGLRRKILKVEVLRPRFFLKALQIIIMAVSYTTLTMPQTYTGYILLRSDTLHIKRYHVGV
ncbi:hypothetical protein QNH91_16910, partial [Klebsiella pneumoniae]|uniref:hypothetical protein n=1 Tax=Klebsiella pneumoniae TaxID=573 RepID=UPI0025560C88